MNDNGGSQLSVKQTRSCIGIKPKQRGTLRALGLGRIGRVNTLPDRPEIRGMLARVPHLVKVKKLVIKFLQDSKVVRCLSLKEFLN